MQPPDHILAVFTLFGSQYPKWIVTEDTLRSWSVLLGDMAPDAILRASIEHCRNSKWPPTVAEIRELAVRPSDSPLTPEAAWEEVMGEIRRVGWCGKPKFSTPDVERAARSMGSWRTLCSQTSDQIAANRAHFHRAYMAMAKTAKREVECVEVDGIIDRMRKNGSTLLGSPASMYGATSDQLDEAINDTLPGFNRADLKALDAAELRSIDEEC